MKKYYCTDEHGVFIGAVELDPFEAIPRGTEVPPPSLSASKFAQWNGVAWLVLDSYPPKWPDLTNGKSELVNQINAHRDELETKGFPLAGLWFQSDQRSTDRLNSTALTASAALISGQPVTFPDWLSADNTPLPVDAAGMLALQAALTQHAGALHQHARALKQQVQAAQTVADLEQIDITAGWPGQQGGV